MLRGVQILDYLGFWLPGVRLSSSVSGDCGAEVEWGMRWISSDRERTNLLSRGRMDRLWELWLLIFLQLGGLERDERRRCQCWTLWHVFSVRGVLIAYDFSRGTGERCSVTSCTAAGKVISEIRCLEKKNRPWEFLGNINP